MNKKKLMLIAAGVALVGGGTAVGLFLGGSDGEPAEPVEEVGLLAMETFLANVSSGSGERYAKVTLQLAVVPRERIKTIEEDPLLTARMRDRILTLLTSKTFEDLNGPIGREALRSEIRLRLTPLVEDGEVREVLFSEFIIQ